MTHQFTVTVSEQHVKAALSHFFVRTMGSGGFVTFGLGILLLAYMTYVGTFGFVYIIFANVLFLSLLFYLVSYFLRRNMAIQMLKKLTSPEVHYELTEKTLGTRTSLGKVELQWEGITDLWMFSDVWLVLFNRNSYITLPADQLSPEIKSFLRQKILVPIPAEA